MSSLGCSHGVLSLPTGRLSIRPPSAVADPCLGVHGRSGGSLSAGVPWTVDDSTVGGHRGHLCSAVLPRSQLKLSCNLLILKRDEKGQGEVWPAGQWWPRSDGRHSRSPLVPSGECTGDEGGGHNSDYKATMSFGVSGSGGMKSIVFVGFYKAAAKTTL